MARNQHYHVKEKEKFPPEIPFARHEEMSHQKRDGNGAERYHPQVRRVKQKGRRNTQSDDPVNNNKIFYQI